MEDFILGLIQSSREKYPGIRKFWKRDHITQRMSERFGIEFNYEKHNQLIDTLLSNKDQYFIQKARGGAEKYKITFEGWEMYLIYNPATNYLITCYPTKESDELIVYLKNPL